MTRTGRIIGVRHGETEWSREKRHTGWTDLDLTDHGRQQAETLVGALARFEPVAVYVSTLRRARETCRIAGYADRAVPSDDCREWNYGDYEGLTADQIRERRPGWTVWKDGVEGGELIGDVAARADRFVASLPEEGDVLVFAHGHFLRILAGRWLGEAPEFGRHLMLGPAAISVLGHERDEPALEHWNDDSHVRSLSAPAEQQMPR